MRTANWPPPWFEYLPDFMPKEKVIGLLEEMRANAEEVRANAAQEKKDARANAEEVRANAAQEKKDIRANAAQEKKDARANAEEVRANAAQEKKDARANAEEIRAMAEKAMSAMAELIADKTTTIGSRDDEIITYVRELSQYKLVYGWRGTSTGTCV
ncbi:hypothetical protein T492DRAFT_44626 [Pavlovales sp. CCMP2436]|nr:hypothetical protein T492DRAFT_44626 [Pavlovales sp. CCMP2436]